MISRPDTRRFAGNLSDPTESAAIVRSDLRIGETTLGVPRAWRACAAPRPWPYLLLAVLAPLNGGTTAGGQYERPPRAWSVVCSAPWVLAGHIGLSVPRFCPRVSSRWATAALLTALSLLASLGLFFLAAKAAWPASPGSGSRAVCAWPAPPASIREPWPCQHQPGPSHRATAGAVLAVAPAFGCGRRP